MNSGALRHSVELQSSSSVPDGMGGETTSWATVATVRAAIWPTSAKEQKQAATPTMVATHQVRIRFYSGIKAEWRVKYGTRYFSIVSIIDREERNTQMDLLCKEVLV